MNGTTSKYNGAALIMSNYPELAAYFEADYNKLVKKVSRRSGTPENAEDVVQEAFYRACKYWPSYNPEQDIKAWFGVILNNACKDKVREDRMMGMTVEFDEEHEEAVRMSEHDHDTAARIVKLIRSKGYPQREVLRLYYEMGYRSVEIKEILDVEHGTVRQAVWKFKEEVKEKLGG